MIRFKKDFKYIVFDTETESLNLRYSRPWQVAFSVCSGDKILEMHDYHVDIPNLAVSKVARQVTGFSDEVHDRRKQPMEKVWAHLAEYLDNPDYHYVGHNILSFDVYQLNNLRREMGLGPDWGYIPRCLDTLCLAKAISANEKSPDRESIYWQYKLVDFHPKSRGFSLTALGKSYGIDFDPLKMHDAKEDITLNQKVFWKQVHEIEI